MSKPRVNERDRELAKQLDNWPFVGLEARAQWIAAYREEVTRELVEALWYLHPKPGTWRTPDDANAARIEIIIAKAEGKGVSD